MIESSHNYNWKKGGRGGFCHLERGESLFTLRRSQENLLTFSYRFLDQNSFFLYHSPPLNCPSSCGDGSWRMVTSRGEEQVV